MYSKRSEIVAFHEASHAVAALVRRVGIRHVKLTDRESGGGEVEIVSRRVRPEIMVEFLLAGPIGQTLKDGRLHARAGNFDYDRAVYFAGFIREDRCEAKALIADRTKATCAMLESKWPLVEGIASALLERRSLDRSDVQTIRAAVVASVGRARG